MILTIPSTKVRGYYQIVRFTDKTQAYSPDDHLKPRARLRKSPKSLELLANSAFRPFGREAMKRQLTAGLGNNSISVRDGASALFRRRGLVLFTFLSVVMSAVAITLLLPNRYDARMKILVKNQRVDIAITPEATTGASSATVENEVSENQINSEIELLTSTDLLAQVVKETGLANHSGGWFGGPLPEAARVEKAVNALAKDLTITPVRKANIISISYSSGSPQTAAAVLKKLGDFYLEKHLKLNHPAGASDFFKNKADEYESQLKEAEQRLTNFQQSNELVVLGQQKELTLQRTADAKTKLLDAETALSEATNKITR
ncbi:MAG: GumC family protein, partial [Pseudonocardiaceae bacterium]